jgi:hypothetical protein
MKIMSSAIALTSAMFAAGAAQAGPVVWDQGPGTGTINDSWANDTVFDPATQVDGQTWADSVTLGTTTAITGFNLFTDQDVASHIGASDFQLKVLLDDGYGEPGDFLVTENLGYKSITAVAPDMFEVSFQFAPITFAAGTTYWIGMAGIGFDAGQYSIDAPQDDQMAQFDGDIYDFVAPFGDQMFQLTTVPEPANAWMLGAGAALLAFMARRRRA